MELEAIRDVFYWIQIICVPLLILFGTGVVMTLPHEEHETALKVAALFFVTFLLIITVVALLKAGMNIQEYYQ